MKLKLALLIIFFASVTMLRAATNDLTSRLQQGLFDEEASHDLTAAIADYQSLATQFDRDRQIAATAIYRLGECYRKLGQTNEAAGAYRRVIKEFGEQQDLVTLSRQNLTGMGLGTSSFQEHFQKIIDQSVETNVPETINTIADQARHWRQQLDTVRRLEAITNISNIIQIAPTILEDSRLIDLINQYNQNDTEIMQSSLKRAYDGDSNSENDKIRTGELLKKDLAVKIKDRLEGLDQAFTLELAILKDSTPPNTSSIAPAITDEESAEIIRIQQLIQNSPDLINVPAEGKDTPLTTAAGQGWLKVSAYLLDHGADVNAGQNRPLTEAARAGNRAMVELLLSRGADMNARDSEGNTALMIAAKMGYQAVVETLLAHKADVNTRNQNNWGETALHKAAENGHDSIIHLLIAAGADANALDDRPQAPLIPAILDGSVDSVRVLLKAGANPNLENYEGRTPVSYAAASGSVEMLTLLLDARGNPNGGKRDAPLLHAIHNKDLVSAELLLKAGANPNITGPESSDMRLQLHFTPLYEAVSTKQPVMVQLLLKYHADPNGEQADKRPLIFEALDDTNLLETLLDAGAQVDARDTTARTFYNHSPDWTPLLNAVTRSTYPEQHFPLAAVSILLRHGANPNLPDNSLGMPPLQWSTGWRDRIPDRRVLELLLDDKADPNLPNFAGQTLLGLLKQILPNRSSEEQATIDSLADFLRQHGALDDLPDWNHITATRPSANLVQTVFARQTNDWNQFTLLDLVAVECQLLARTPRQGANGASYTGSLFWRGRLIDQPLPFADLTQIRIHRRGTSGTNTSVQMVDLGTGLVSGNFSNNLFLKWGDTVEIPEADHPINEAWTGFPVVVLTNLDKCLTRHIEVVIKGQTNHLTLGLGVSYQKEEAPRSPEFGGDGSGTGEWIYTEILHTVSFWLGPVLLESKLVLASSDLAHVKVTRADPATGKTLTHIVDCSSIRQNQFSDSDVWLRDGDVIEVPEKP